MLREDAEEDAGGHAPSKAGPWPGNRQRGQPEQGSPTTGAPTKAGQGTYWHLRRRLELRGAERGAALGASVANEHCKTKSLEHLSA